MKDHNETEIFIELDKTIGGIRGFLDGLTPETEYVQWIVEELNCYLDNYKYSNSKDFFKE